MKVLAPTENRLQEDLDHVLAHTEQLWSALRDRSIFVTGGTGFFGRWLLESFAHANRQLGLGANMTVLSRDPAAFARKAPHLVRDRAIQFVTGDVRRFEADDFARPRFDFMVHAATEASAKLNAQDPLRMFDTIVQGTRAALEFAVACGAKRFLFTSSGAVYGSQPSDLTHIPEDYQGAPICSHPGAAYGEGKRAAELLCSCFHEQYGIETLIARCFAFVGPFLPLDAHFAVGNFIRDARRGGAIRVEGDGTSFRSYLYAADLAIWLWTILFAGEPMRPYNVGSSHDLTVAELANTVRQSVDLDLKTTFAGTSQGAPPQRYVPANTRALTELALSEYIGLPDAIHRTVRHLEFEEEGGN